ncbi:MAG: F0F1 ATP synthase subunit epsilon [Candidatus Rokubacteria bacterium RIFCSPLOWO2_02_FULL_73_56]|nr:MAG: F0F1 ATP synthase subunit epsilon [Candidatus Rokubacteria bacterium RIFCSPHIGHO2_02_FULL_73_26]OGL07560.1 MAG: F0F1 ATP synthase subunit epsilon [Candidatus Rokubacteria bacterium RIFCSPLOWO2_02_FULL_73_56]OGL21121.1 MAG: F0F1 ATP synthase subunit epsilon [Candidatus Rokubacteria bacterium RIFCSPLOWO2_12_FULL_73_47]
MTLRVLTAARVLVDEAVTKVVAEAANGWFCLLPRHVDFVTALVPGVLVFTTRAGAEGVVATDHAILVKCGAEVLVSTWRGAAGDDLATLRGVVAREFLQIDDRERTARSALARLEAGVVRRFVELEGRA